MLNYLHPATGGRAKTAYTHSFTTGCGLPPAGIACPALGRAPEGPPTGALASPPSGTRGGLRLPGGYPASLLLFALVTWYCGLLRIPVALALLLFVGLAAYSVRRGGEYRNRELRAFLVWDAVFLVGFLFALSVRFTNPVIGYFSEQYMNHAFIASIIREPVVPPLDPGLRAAASPSTTTSATG